MTDLSKLVKPGEIERAVWSAMIWAAKNNPGSKGVPEYTDGGNSFAEDECRATAARIIAALDLDALARWRDEAVQAEREACAEAVESLWAYRTCSEVAAAIRARKGGEA
jgi:hypothetical protein